MKILFYGNCQTEVAMAAIAANNPNLHLDYAGNSNRVTKYDPQRTAQLMDWCDHIITQPVMNPENPDHHAVLRARFAGKITFMPYLWIDGLFSVCGLPENKSMTRGVGFVGQTYVTDHLQRAGFVQTLQDFRDGRIDFQHAHRFESTMAELAERETFADVRVASFVRDRYRDQVVMLTHNHPHPVVVNEIARQIAARLGLDHAEIRPEDHAAYSEITLPEFGKIFSPFVAADLGLRHASDLQWQRRGQDIITQIADGMEGLADRPSRTDLQAKTFERKDLIEERQAQTEALRAQSDEVKAQNEVMRAQIAERQALIAEKQAQTEALKVESDDHRAQNEELRAQNAERQALIAEKQAQTRALKGQTLALKAQTDEHKARNEETKTQNEVLRAQNAERHALNAERQVQIEVMKTQTAEKQRLIAERQVHKDTLQAQNTRLRAQRAEGRPQGPVPPPPKT